MWFYFVFIGTHKENQQSNGCKVFLFVKDPPTFIIYRDTNSSASDCSYDDHIST